jgi:hypothetical protein
VELSQETLCQLLADKVRAYKVQNPEKHSYTYMAGRAGVSASFVERAYKKQLTSFDPKRTVSLAKFVCTEEETKSVADYFADKFIQENSDILQDAIYEKFIKKNQSGIPAELNRLLVQENTAIIYNLSCLGAGVSEETAQKLFGVSGLEALESLSSKGFIKKEEDRFKGQYDNISASFEAVKAQLGFFSKLYKPQNVGKKKNYAFIITQKMSHDGIIEAQEAYREFHTRIRNIKDRNPGENDHFMVGFMDNFLTEEKGGIK